jgi:hypothetical protein
MPPSKPKSLSREQQKLWTHLNEFIREGGGWIISLPTTLQIRLETILGSSLPEDLKEAGYNIHHIGRHERLMPSTITEHRGTKTFTTQIVAPGVADVWQFDLPQT